MPPDTMPPLSELTDAVGIWAIPIAAVVVLIRAARSPDMQAALPPRWRWKSWPLLGQLAAVFLLSFLGSLATALVGGLGLKAALIAAAPVAIGAVFGHKTTKAIGHKAQSIAQMRDPFYQPSKARKAASIIFPIDHRSIIALPDKPNGSPT